MNQRDHQAQRILSCYSNVSDCIPSPIVKAEEAEPLKVLKEDSLEKANTPAPIFGNDCKWRARMNNILADIQQMKIKVLTKDRKTGLK